MEQHSPIFFLVPPELSFLFFYSSSSSILFCFPFCLPSFFLIFHFFTFAQSQDWTWLVHLDLTTDKTKCVSLLFCSKKSPGRKSLKTFRNQSTQLFSFNQSTLIFLLVFITFFSPLNSWNYFAVYIFFRFKALIYSTPTVADLDGDGR